MFSRDDKSTYFAALSDHHRLHFSGARFGLFFFAHLLRYTCVHYCITNLRLPGYSYSPVIASVIPEHNLECCRPQCCPVGSYVLSCLITWRMCGRERVVLEEVHRTIHESRGPVRGLTLHLDQLVRDLWYIALVCAFRSVLLVERPVARALCLVCFANRYQKRELVAIAFSPS